MGQMRGGNVSFRLLWILLRSWWQSSLTPIDESVLKLRVWPTDLDLERQMHLRAYLSAMEWGRLDLMARLGLLALLWKQRWHPQIVAVNMRYLYPLKAFQRYELSTRLVCWDNQGIYIEQRFQCNKKTIAVGQVKAIIMGRSSTIAPGYLLEILGYDSSSPTMPVEIQSAIQCWTKVH